MAKKSDGQWLANALDLAAGSCQTIVDAHGCDRCPLYGTCLDDSTFTDVALSFTAGHWWDFLDLAEELEGYISEEDAAAMYWDSLRDRDIDMALEEEYDRTDKI